MLRDCQTVGKYLLLLLPLLQAGLWVAGLPAPQTQYTEFYADYKSNHIDDKIKYTFHYYIDHAASHVHINHREERHGDQVKGQYGLVEPDGNVRTVHYAVDADKGFHTVVQTRTAFSRTHQSLQLHRDQPKQPLVRAKPVAFVL